VLSAKSPILHVAFNDAHRLGSDCLGGIELRIYGRGPRYRKRAISSTGTVGRLSWRIFKMRVLLGIAPLVFGIVSVIAANAADDPGVIARSYRPSPPHHQHYYPTTGVKPKIGRAEDLLAPNSAPEPEKTYRRNY
jgi:hypothetical protein